MYIIFFSLNSISWIRVSQGGFSGTGFLLCMPLSLTKRGCRAECAELSIPTQPLACSVVLKRLLRLCASVSFPLKWEQ